jgi:5-formyltetrahydrofolate cyclo-ligase
VTAPLQPDGTRQLHAAEEKTLLRRRLRDHALPSGAAATAAAHAATERLLTLPEIASASRLVVCLSFGDEIDTWPLVDRLLASGRDIYVPRAEPADRQLHLHRYPCELRTLAFGLQQPPRTAPELPAAAIDSTVDAAIALGLAFDVRGYRLGYGTGYFDRFLARRPFPAIGFAFDSQIIDHMPEEPHDVPMAALVTESSVWRNGHVAGTTVESPPDRG